ncbi:hypothetical protein ACIQW7_24470 [Peribacillus simplex]|uniref:hypothetical protein n=1 Tax=Peribacillus simplex TaxID=1478 RepID=UPI003827B0CD
MYLLPKEIEEEKKSYTKKPTVYKNGAGFPYNDLTDRQFEVLLYSIYKEEINSGELKNFDTINLMQGIGERGRDCTLHFNGGVVGAIQCKKYNKRISKPELAKEIIKFTLHYILDKKLITKPENFSYIFAVSNDFSEPALDLINDFNSKICVEVDFELWTKEVIEAYKAFKGISLDAIREELLTVLKLIRVSKITASDLNLTLNKYQHLITFFFEVEKVISLEENKKMIKDVIHSVPKLIELDDFKSRQMKKSNKLPFSNLFIGRDRELDELSEQVSKGIKIIIIDGVPGIGKTRFTIELAEKILSKNYYDKILVINDTLYNSVAPLLVELDKDMKYVLLVDDANRIENLHELKELLFNHSLNTEPVIVLNVRSYNLDRVAKEVKSWELDGILQFNLKRLSNGKVDTILQQEPFDIITEEYRKEIVLTCKGNPRLAAIMAEVKKRDGNIINKKPYDLFKSYFEGVFTELVYLISENYKEKALLALIAMLRTIQLSNEKLIIKIKEILQFENDIEFNNSINRLYEYEIIEISPHNSTMKIFDDSVSEYIFFRYIFADTSEILNFEQMFDVFEETHASNIIENIVALTLKGYVSDKLKAVIDTLPYKTLQILKSDVDEQIKLKYLDWMTKYVQTNPKESFHSVYNYWRTKKSCITDSQAKLIVGICESVAYMAWDTHLKFVIEFLREIMLYGILQEAQTAASSFLSRAFKYSPPMEREGKNCWFYKHQEIMLETVERWLSSNVKEEEVSLVINMLSQLCKNHFSNDYMDYIDNRKFIMVSGGLHVTSDLLEIRTRTFNLLIKLFKEERVTDSHRLEILKALNYPFDAIPHGNEPSESLTNFDAEIILQEIEGLANFKDNLLIKSKINQLIYRIRKVYNYELADLLLTKLENKKLTTFEKVIGTYWSRKRSSLNWRDVEVEKKEFAMSIVSEISEKNELNFLNEMFQWQSWLLIDNKSYTQMIGEILRNLAKIDVTLGKKIIEELKGNHQYLLLRVYLKDILVGIGEGDSDLKRKLCLELLAESNTDYFRTVAFSYSRYNLVTRNYNDINILTLLVEFDDNIVDSYLVITLLHYQDIDEKFVKSSIRTIIERCKEDTYSELLHLLEPQQEDRDNYKFYKTDIAFFKEILFGTTRLSFSAHGSLDFQLAQSMKYLLEVEGTELFIDYLRGRIKQKELTGSYKYNLLLSDSNNFEFINETQYYKSIYKGLINEMLYSSIKEDITDLIVDLIGNHSNCYDLFKELLQESEKWIDIIINLLRKLPTVPEWFNVVEELTLRCFDVEKLNKLYSAFYPKSYWGSGEDVYKSILDNIILNKQRFTSYEMLSFLEEAEGNIRSTIKGIKERIEGEEEYI